MGRLQRGGAFLRFLSPLVLPSTSGVSAGRSIRPASSKTRSASGTQTHQRGDGVCRPTASRRSFSHSGTTGPSHPEAIPDSGASAQHSTAPAGGKKNDSETRETHFVERRFRGATFFLRGPPRASVSRRPWAGAQHSSRFRILAAFAKQHGSYADGRAAPLPSVPRPFFAGQILCPRFVHLSLWKFTTYSECRGSPRSQAMETPPGNRSTRFRKLFRCRLCCGCDIWITP